MAIRNGFGITGYEDQPKPLDGQPGGNVSAPPKANPLAPQEATLLFGGTPTDGVYSQEFIGPDGTTLTVSVTRAGGLPATNADLAAQAVANTTADDAWANVATLEVDDGTAEQANITWLHPSTAYALGATAAPAPGTLAPTITVNAGGGPIPVGRFLIAVPNAQDPDIPAAGLPLVGTTAPQIIGVNLRDGSVENSGLPGAAIVESTPAGRMMSVAKRGPVYMTNHGTIQSVPEAAVFAVVNPAGGNAAGQARADADGGNTVALTKAQAYWIDAVDPGERGLIMLNGL